MKWNEIQQKYPNQWVIVEALDAYTSHDQKRNLVKMSVLEQCYDGADAYKKYLEIHNLHPEREYYYVHTSQDQIDIVEETRLGPRI